MAKAGRSQNGKFRKNPATAEQDARACELYAKGYTLREISQELGWADPKQASRAVERAYAAVVSPSVEAARKRSVERLDRAHRTARHIMEKEHVMVSHGRVITDENGIPLLDDAPRLQAIDRIVKIEHRLAATMGWDAPVKHSVDVVQRDALHAEMESMMAELEANDAKTPEGDASGLVHAGGVEDPDDAG